MPEDTRSPKSQHQTAIAPSPQTNPIAYFLKPNSDRRFDQQTNDRNSSQIKW
jgi:hypothetical protein